MVSFKNNNASRELILPHRHSSKDSENAPGSSCNLVGNSIRRNNAQETWTKNRPVATKHLSINITRLEKPVTNPSLAMDNKKFVQCARMESGTCMANQIPNRTEESVASGIRRRSGGAQGLRSPAAKRPVSAPVALQGWLHKQGSEGLMLWKKRWFVLSEYCLFYYKGPEEEKLLGSILLPSYRVTVCRPEEKLNKKFAFKAEHANMRTYHFAADSPDTMYQWVNALTLASLLQDPSSIIDTALLVEMGKADNNVDRSARPSVSSISSILNQSADDSDSGFHGFQSRGEPSHASNNNSSPNSVTTGSFPNCNASNNNVIEVTGNSVPNNRVQPLANGWIQQPSPHAKLVTSQKQMQIYLQQGHSHQRRPLQLHQPPHYPSSQSYRPTHMGPQHFQQTEQSSQFAEDCELEGTVPAPKHFVHAVYANAPPKPKRLTDNCGKHAMSGSDADYRKSSVSPERQMNGEHRAPDSDKSEATRIESRPNPDAHQNVKTDKLSLTYGHSQLQLTERRTPDTYGRSVPVQNRQNKVATDYEDVYGVPQLYQRPSEPVGYSKGSLPSPIVLPFRLQQQLPCQQHVTQQQQFSSPASPQSGLATKQYLAQPPPRPHSADFLESESSRRTQHRSPTSNSETQSQTSVPQRPKSSLEIVNPSDYVNEYYFYSEERYAAQMRQSAVYLHQAPQHLQHQRNQSLSRTTPSNEPYPSGEAINNQPKNIPESLRTSLNCAKHEEIYQDQNLSFHSSQRNEGRLRRSLREQGTEKAATHQASPLRQTDEYDYNGRPTAKYRAPHDNKWCNEQRQQQPKFVRSASARLPRTRQLAPFHDQNAGDEDEDDYTGRSTAQSTCDGERKIQQREESMKRLLEWKQRMLQSPLTRKPAARIERGRIPNELSTYYKQQALMELAAQEATAMDARYLRRDEDVCQRPHARSKSSDSRRTAASIPRYSSYSSDDEDLADVRRKRTRRPSHAGKSPQHVEDAARPQSCIQSRSSATSEASGNVLHTTTTRSAQRVRCPKERPGDASLSSLRVGDVTPDANYEGTTDLRSIYRADERARRTSSNEYDGVQRTGESFARAGDDDPPRNRTSIANASTSHVVDQRVPRCKTRESYVTASYGRKGIYATPGDGHWDLTKSKEEWDSKIDENGVVKEYSYQYIKPEDISANENKSSDQLGNTNLVQCRIKSFESSIGNRSSEKEMLSMQKPLEMSSLHATEAHVSKLNMSRRESSVIPDFLLGDVALADVSKDISVPGHHAKQTSVDSNKSVKDILADFERISQRTKEPCERYQEIKHPDVVSDTETLLYGAESDVDQRERPREESDKEERIKTTDSPTSQGSNKASSMDTVSGRSVDVKESRDKVTSEDNSEVIPSSVNGEISVVDDARFNPTNSLASCDDHVSKEAQNTNLLSEVEGVGLEEHYLPMSPRKAILDPKNDDRPHPTMMESLFANLAHEESSYVEMTQNGVGHSLLAPIEANDKRDSGDYSTMDTSHYEFICVLNGKVEPVYMEVNPRKATEAQSETVGKKKVKRGEDNKDVSSRQSDLPDILTTLKSDSSDADDESSRDFDSIDAPRHPRFSLSDTFRPASYYLGASQTIITELHDSSDSELVSPPPIPTSPLPLDDLQSLETRRNSLPKKNSVQTNAGKNGALDGWSQKAYNKPTTTNLRARFSDGVIGSAFRDSRISLESASGSDSVELRNSDEEARNRRLKRRPVSDEVCEVLNSLDELESLESRFDSASIDVDQFLDELQARDAFNIDLYAKDRSYKNIYGFNENASVTDKSQKGTRQNSPRETNPAAREKSHRDFHYGIRCKASSASSLPSMRVSDLLPSHQYSQSFTGDSHYENVVNFSPSSGSPVTHFDQSTSESQSRNRPIDSQNDSPTARHSRESSNAEIYARERAFARLSTNSSTLTDQGQSAPVDNASNQSTIGHHPDERFHDYSGLPSRETMHYSFPTNSSPNQSPSRHNATLTVNAVKPYLQHPYLTHPEEHRAGSNQISAPYYYSDLRETVNNAGSQSNRAIGHSTRLPQLNNQRNDASRINKRNDIGRIVNPITRQIPRHSHVEDMDDAKRIAVELSRTTCQLLTESKVDLVDKRNFYESDTLRKAKSTDPFPDFFLSDIDSRNLYLHGPVDKCGASSQTIADERTSRESHQATTSHRRSRSLEGLLDEVGLQNLVEMTTRECSVASASTSSPNARRGDDESSVDRASTSRASRFNVDDPWEQDSLWRESLRRVSLRHARSLDNLEMPSKPTTTTTTTHGNESRGRSKITRNTTYVNDSVVQRRDDCATKSQDESRESATSKDYNRDSVVESGRFLADGDVTSSRSIPAARSSEETSALFEFDREKLRQWDLLSSACLLQEQQTGASLTTVDRRGDEQIAKTTRHVANKPSRSTTKTCAHKVADVGTSNEKVGTESASNSNVWQYSRVEGKMDESKETRCRIEASGSGSVIGRDPLPPRATHASHLAQRANHHHARMQQQQQQSAPPVQTMPMTSTLPLTRNSCAHRQPPSAIRQSTPQLPTHLLKTASSVDVRIPSPARGNVPAISMSLSPRRLISPVMNLRVVSPIDNTLSSPSDSERQVNNSYESKMDNTLERDLNYDVNHRQGYLALNYGDLTYKKSVADLQKTGKLSGSGGLVRVSAGELLGRTHEELVLLLIQLRRQSSMICKAMEACHAEIEAQARLAEMENPCSMENFQKLEELRKHLTDLEKQYEKGKPLVNLVDNMVKLGSLYTCSGSSGTITSNYGYLRDNATDSKERMEFNQKMQEQRLLAEERKDWERLIPNRGQLQAKVQQLYRLDRLLQEESGTLQSLQQDKKILEKALGGVRHKLQGSRSNPVETERYKKQQHLLESELSRVRLLLAHNSKRLEETVAENARLEQDLVVLRQKLQASRKYTGNMRRDTTGTTAALEIELRRVQQLVGNLQKQRQELSMQVRQLTEKSHSLVQQIRPQISSVPQVHQPKKRSQSSWLVTDLDSGITVDHGWTPTTSPLNENASQDGQIVCPAFPHSLHSEQHKETTMTGNNDSYHNSTSNRHYHQELYERCRQNNIAALSPQVCEQIHQHQLKHQLLKDQMQGKASPVQLNTPPLYVNTTDTLTDAMHNENNINGVLLPSPEYIPPVPAPPSLMQNEDMLANEIYFNAEDKYANLPYNREKQEIKTVRIVKRESERRQRDRGEKTGNVGIPLSANHQTTPEGLKKFVENDVGSPTLVEKNYPGKMMEDYRKVPAQNDLNLAFAESYDSQFQRSMSLPRGFGGQRQTFEIQQGPVQPPPRSDSVHALKNIIARRYRARHDGGSDRALSTYTDSLSSSSPLPINLCTSPTSPSFNGPTSQRDYCQLSPSHQSGYACPASGVRSPFSDSASSIKSESLADVSSPGPISPISDGAGVVGAPRRMYFGSVASIASLLEPPQLSPVFKSEAAKQIVKEVAECKVKGPLRRQVPKKKRRHYTVSSSKPVLDFEDSTSKMEIARARDDLDMERALRPRINAPDVVRSTLNHKELKYNESTIDQLLGTPNKIVIPERYIPEQVPELTAAEQERRLKKVESIKKMLSETTVTAPEAADENPCTDRSDTLKRKVAAERRQREHILQLNQILAKQVMEKSKIVAEKALATLPLTNDPSFDNDDLSPVTPLPIYQQRENFYS